MEEPIRPQRLQPGATIGVAAVSGPADREKLDQGIEHLQKKQYRVVEAANLRTRKGFLAGADEERAAGYRDLLVSPSVDAIFFARGGYGSSRILRHLLPAQLRANPKIHLGGSDLTALFAYIRLHAGLIAFHGPMVAVEMAEERDLDWETMLSGRPLAPHSVAAGDVLAPGRSEGVLVGGCLSLLASLCGTPEEIRGEGAILFWEDTGEDTYRLDRMLTQLERAGAFDGLRGMVIGSVVPRRDGETPETVRAYLKERFAGAPFPTAMGLACGHLARPRTLPLGARARLDLDETLTLAFPGAVVQ